MYKLLAWVAQKNYWLRSFLYNLFIKNYTYSNRRVWQHGWKRIILKNSEQPVRTRIHGYSVVVNCGSTYPLIARIYRKFNNPLVQLVYQTYSIRQRSICIIDVGASIGDTVLVLIANLPGIFKKIICIEGHDESYKHLCQNMKQFSYVECVHALLSNSAQEKNLVRIHSGSFSIQGQSNIQAATLDEVLMKKEMEFVDILKIDVDGFDGKVLAGATEILTTQKPQVIFEWHPALISKTGNDFNQHFIVLRDCGYKKFLFFNKFGDFSHFMQDIQTWELEQLAALCLNNKFSNDWHYDVIALSDDLTDVTELAECSFAKNKKNAC